MAGRSRSKRTKVRGNSTKAQFATGLADIVLTQDGGREFRDQVHTFSCLSVLHNGVVA